MPQTASRKKDLRQSLRHRSRNLRRKRAMKQATKIFMQVVRQGDPAATQEAFRQAQQCIDKAAKQGIIKQNTASRRKARLSRLKKAAETA
jgi:small subunit ribosomal protein S20